MPILEASVSGPGNSVVMEIYEVVEKNAIYQKALNLLRMLDFAKKKQPRTDLRASSTCSKKSIK